MNWIKRLWWSAILLAILIAGAISLEKFTGPDGQTRARPIVHENCVGCGVCSAVCPRGVLKLENGDEEGRINEMPIIIGNNSITVKA